MSFKKRTVTGERERRFFKVNEFRVKPESDGIVFEGHSAVFNSPSVDLGWGDFQIREYIAPGAFQKVLKISDCRALFNHNPDYVLGRQSAGTLLLSEDDKGLFSTVNAPDTQIARDLSVSIGRGDIREQSFCFVVGGETWEEDNKNKIATRTIHEISELIDISIVTFPAYPDTDAAKRSLEAFRSGQAPVLLGSNDGLENRYIDVLLTYKGGSYES